MGNYIASVSESDALDSFQKSYAQVHGYIALVAASIGLFGNTANIIVLTRPSMTSATNTVLTGLAISDSLRIISFIPHLVHNVILYPVYGNIQNLTYTSAVIDFIYMVAGMTLQAVCIWITIILVIIRCIATEKPLNAHIYCSQKRMIIAMVISVVGVLITMGIPSVLSLEIALIPAAEYGYLESNDTIWVLTAVFETETDIIMQNIFSWTNAILNQLIPCLILSVLSRRLVLLIRQTNERCKDMSWSQGQAMRARERKTNTVNRMLVVVVALFLLSELPHAILMVCNGLIDGFLLNVYDRLLLVIDLMTLFNNSINFLIYCSMSELFRKKFVELFCKCTKSAVQYN